MRIECMSCMGQLAARCPHCGAYMDGGKFDTCNNTGNFLVMEVWYKCGGTGIIEPEQNVQKYRCPTTHHEKEIHQEHIDIHHSFKEGE